MADDEAQTAPTVTALTSGNSMKGDLTALLKGLGREVCDVPTCKERSALAVFCDERKMPDPRVHENSVGALLRILSELPRGGSHPGFKKYKARACSSAHLAVCLDIRDEKSAELGWCGDDYYYALEPHDDPRDTLVQEVIEVGARKTDSTNDEAKAIHQYKESLKDETGIPLSRFSDVRPVFSSDASGEATK